MNRQTQGSGQAPIAAARRLPVCLGRSKELLWMPWTRLDPRTPVEAELASGCAGGDCSAPREVQHECHQRFRRLRYLRSCLEHTSRASGTNSSIQEDLASQRALRPEWSRALAAQPDLVLADGHVTIACTAATRQCADPRLAPPIARNRCHPLRLSLATA